MIKIGDIFQTKNCGKCEVIDYQGHSQITIRWFDYPCVQNGIFAAALKKGTVKNPMQPSVCGVGFVGLGPHLVNISGVLTKEYTIWHSMLVRCYDEKSLKIRPSYLDKTVCEKWFNFQNFAGWCKSQAGFDQEGWHLDKDGIVKNNKIYSPETCCFVPKELNSFFLVATSARGNYPLGVSFDHTKGKFSSSCSKDGKSLRLGMFETAEEAFFEYKVFKEYLARELSVKYFGLVDIRLINALNNYEVNIED